MISAAAANYELVQKLASVVNSRITEMGIRSMKELADRVTDISGLTHSSAHVFLDKIRAGSILALPRQESNIEGACYRIASLFMALELPKDHEIIYYIRDNYYSGFRYPLKRGSKYNVRRKSRKKG